MDNNLILNSIGIGGAIFVALILFWFISRYLKKRWTSDQSARGYTPSTKFSWEEKRAHPRIAISWQASLEATDQTDDVQLKDISLGGAFVVCADPLALNARFKISIRIPDQEPLGLNAEVVWSNKNMPPDRVVNRGMGIRFIENTENDRQRLEKALAAAVEGNQPPRS
jgi:Tfp pilus assembly protein PilZ